MAKLSPADAVRTIHRIALELSAEARRMLAEDADRDKWLDRVERLAERDIEGELHAAAVCLFKPGRPQSTHPARRAVADVIESVQQLRRWVPAVDTEPGEGNDGQPVLLWMTVEAANIPLDLIRAELRGRFRRLRAVAGVVDFTGDQDDDRL